MSIEKEILKRVKNGESYNSVAKKLDMSYHNVSKICKEHGVVSSHRHISDKKIIDTIKENDVVTISELLGYLGYSSSKNMKRRLDKLKMQNKLKSTSIPVTRHRNRSINIFNGYINVTLYYVSKQDLEDWVWGKLPASMPQNLRKAITRRLHDLGLKVDLVEKTEYRAISFPRDKYKKLQKKAKKHDMSIHEMIEKKCGV